MASCGLPVFMRVGTGSEHHVGDLPLDPGGQPGIALAALLRKIADGVESEQASLDWLAAVDAEISAEMPADLRDERDAR